MDREKLKVWAGYTAAGLLETGIEGSFASVSCSTAGDYPSIGCSQWEGERADRLLALIPGGLSFVGRAYSEIRESGALETLAALLDTPLGRLMQRHELDKDCLSYMEALEEIRSLSPAGRVYAGMWCPTSTAVVVTFLRNREPRLTGGSVETLHRLFHAEYPWAAGAEVYAEGYRNRAERTYAYVKGLNLS